MRVTTVSAMTSSMKAVIAVTRSGRNIEIPEAILRQVHWVPPKMTLNTKDQMHSIHMLKLPQSPKFPSVLLYE